MQCRLTPKMFQRVEHVEVHICCQSSIIANNAATEKLEKVQDFVTKIQLYKLNSSFYVNS